MSISQAEFTRGLLDAALPAPDGVVNPDGTPSTKRYDVYRNNVAVGLSEALNLGFPVIRKLVGEEFFVAMAGVYLRKHLPTSPVMMSYGEKMPSFLGLFQPAQSLPYLPDMARLELAIRHAYHAADAAPIDSDALAAVAPDALMALRMTLAPSTQAISSQYPVHAIYRANTTADAPKPVMQAESVLVTRAEFDPEIHLITAAEAKLVVSLQRGHPLGVAMTDAGPDVDLGKILGLLLRERAVTKLN